MTEQAFASVWGLSYSDSEFLNRFGAKSRVAIACQLLFFRQHARFPADRSDLDPDVIAYVADQHPEHDWAKEAGYVDWAHDEIHADAVSEQFTKLQRQKTRRTSRWVMEG